MGIQRGRVPVVVVDHRKPEAFGQRPPDVEAAPAGMAEVRRALGRDDAIPAGRTRSIKAHRADRRYRHAGEREHLLHGVDQRLDGLVRALPDVARNLRHLVDKEPAIGIENRSVVRGSAVVEANHDPVDWHAPSSSGR